MKENEKNDKMKEFKVLIVDDVPENIQVLAHLLNEKGLKVSYADSGIKALKAIKNNLPDLILLDVSMPGMDGFEVCEKLKNDELTADIPVIFLTAKVDQQDVINGLEKGAVDYVTKPFNAKELTRRVFTHLELKHNRDFIKKQNDELVKLNEVKNQLFSVISHDMKNLFHVILFGSESLKDETGDFNKDGITQIAGTVHDSAKRAYDLLQNLLEWSRSQMDNVAVKPLGVDLHKLVKQSVSLFSPMIQNKKLKVEVFPDGNDFSAFADIDMVRVILRNLLSNAIKYSFSEGHIDILVKELPDTIKVSIKDHGVGMDKEQLQILLNESQPALTSPGTQNEKGSGLGMILIKDFVAKNQGTFGIESEKGKGSLFWFSLPRQKPG